MSPINLFSAFCNAIFLLFLLVAPSSSYACTRIFWNSNTQTKVFARSMDLYISDIPTLVVYPRHIVRSGETQQNPLHWQSKYGSVVVTAFHSNAASDGMNERGLAAHLLYLTQTDYVQRNTKLPGISNAIWVQYVLDNFSTVNEVIKHLDHFQVVPIKVNNMEWPLHLVIEDASGDSAIIEFLGGKTILHHGRQYTVLTNDPAYAIQLSNLKRYSAFAGDLPLPGATDSISRFVRASFFLKNLPNAKTKHDAICAILSALRPEMVAFGAGKSAASAGPVAGKTRWISLGDLSNKIYYFQSTDSLRFTEIDLSKIDLANKDLNIVIDPNPSN